jgi:hypothetical protein
VSKKKDGLIDNADLEGLIKKLYFTHTQQEARRSIVNLQSSAMQRAANVRRASHWKDIKQLSHVFSFVGVSIIRRKMGSALMDKDLHPSCEEIIFLKIISYIKKAPKRDCRKQHHNPGWFEK